MSLEDTVRQTCSSLTSVRFTDRKKSAFILKDFLTQNAVPALLSSNTRKKSGYSWNHVFGDIHDFIIKETEKHDTKSFDKVTVPLCTTLLHSCVAGANKGQAYIKCKLIMDACLHVLNNRQMREAIGDAYLSLLYKHVLPVDNYLGFIVPAVWENLLDIAMTACLSNRTLDDLIKIRLLWLVVKNAIAYCHFTNALRDSLLTLKKCCNIVLLDKRVQEFVIKIVLSVLETLSTEVRLTMCEFSESILPSLLKLYEPSMEEKNKSLLFKLFKTAIAIHQPRGRLQNSNGTLAFNWDVWNKHLHSMLEIVYLEVNYVQKMRKKNENSMNCEYFYHVAASTFYQIFNYTPEKENVDEAVPSAKKLRLSFNTSKSFNDLIEDQLRANPVPWVGIIQMYVKHFGQSITYIQYLSLIGVLEKTISDTKKNVNWERLDELTCLTIKNMLSLSGSDDVDSGNYSVFLPLWNTCVRNAAVTSAAQKAIHSVLQVILHLVPLKYENVKPLLVPYIEKGMPVNDHTIVTLNCLFHKFYRKSCYTDIREKCFAWLKYGSVTSIDISNLNSFLLRLLINDNIPLKSNCDILNHNDVYKVLFNTTDDSILYSDFEYKITEIAKVATENDVESVEINSVMYNVIQVYFEKILADNTLQLDANNLKLIEYIKYVQIIIIFFDALLKYKFKINTEVKEMSLYTKFQIALKILYETLTRTLKSDVQIRDKVLLLKGVQDMLLKEYDPILNVEIRSHIRDSCFHCLNDIIKQNINLEDDYCEESEDEFNIIGLKQNCIYVLVAYCRKHCSYTDEVLKCVLDRDLYRFTTNFEYAFHCINILNDSTVEQPPLELIFGLMLNMCKELFRNPKITRRLLEILSGMLERIWSQNDDIIRQNCIIMIKSYLQRCSENYYPPNVAALVYECLAKIIQLNGTHDLDIIDSFKQTLLKKIVENSEHKIRLYCSHLLSILGHHFSDSDIYLLAENLLNIFTIDVAENNETVLKDEKLNRTSTVLHTFFILGKTKKSAIHKIILKVLKFQNEKPMEAHMVKKVLNMLTEVVTDNTIEVYMKNNVLRILQYWFKENINFKKLPLYLFGFDDMDGLLANHVNWLVPADILWSHNGIVADSNVLKYVTETTSVSTEKIIEACFCNLIALCLPHIVIEKYKLEDAEHFSSRETANAHRMFQLTSGILKKEKWSNLFAENLGEIMLISATHVRDCVGASELYGVQLVDNADPFTYSPNVFSAILKYFGALINENIMQYMCEHQPLVILNILFKLWNNTLHEHVFEFKVLHLHAYISFIKNIPLGQTTDAILCNLACDSIAHGIKGSKSKEVIKIFVDALMMVITKILTESPKSVDNIQTSVLPKIVSILIIKTEEGFASECRSLLKYLTEDMKNYLTGSADVVDFVKFITEFKEEESCPSSSRIDFEHKLKTYTLNLSNPSHDTLSRMYSFLKQNREYVKGLYADINRNGFSEICQTSLVHQVILSLNNILKNATEEKIIIDACNCLAEIGTYDIKTLVTVPPMDTTKILNLNPKQYFAQTVISCLTEHLFNEDPTVSNKVTKALCWILKFRDGQAALELMDANTEILQFLVTPSCENFVDYKINNVKFDICKSIDYWIPINNESHSQWVIRITMALLDLLGSSVKFIIFLRALCVLKPTICGKILPSLMGLVLDCATDTHVEVFEKQINEVFKYIWNLSFNDSFDSSEVDGGTKISTKINHDQKMIVQNLLDVVDFLRMQRNHYKSHTRGRTADTLNYLNLDYLWVSWGAAVTERSLAALYYGELWASAKNGNVPPSSPEATTALDNGEHVQKIFRRCFVSIGEMDAIDGCGNAHLTSEREKRKHLIHTGQFSDALFLHDIALSRGAPDEDILYGAITSLHKSGMHHLALRYIKSYPENEELDDVKYDCLSYLGDWSDFVDTQELEEKSKRGLCRQDPIIKAIRYACLKDCMNLRTTIEAETKLEKPLNRAKLATARLCRSLNMENCQNVYRIVSNLHLFRDIETYFSVRCGKMTVPVLLNEWRIENLPTFNDFNYLEALISQRSLMLEHISKNDFSSLPKVDDLQLQYAEFGLSNQRIQMAQRLVAAVKHDETTSQVALLESQISWAKGHKDIALSLLNEIVTKESENQRLNAMSLRQYGLWMAECKRENGKDIIHKYLESSLKTLSYNDDLVTRLKIYSDIAKFADAEYTQVVDYMNSSVFENKVKCMENMEDTAASLVQSQNNLTRDEKKALMTSNAFSRLDKAEIDNTRAEKESALKLAMRYYLLSLSQCDESNLSVFRVISLWVDNPGLNLEEKDSDSGPLGKLLHAIPSWKFITVLPQLAPRLTNENTSFACHLKQIIKTCAIQHPHHTLPILFNLKNSDKDQNIRSAGESSQTNSQEPRILAATALIREVATGSDELARIVAQMELICDATIKFAYYVPESKDTRPQNIPRSQSISHLCDLNAIPIPTDNIPIRKDFDYSKLSTLSSFDKHFELVGGINYPKKISCLSSDGGKRILLVKGEDDLRQDAVMQQVFNIVNSLLENSPITYRNKLHIRTYKVVPMSRRSGVLEWCVGTMPIGAYLGTAHPKYRPQDITPSKARLKLKDCHDNKRPTKRKLEVFNAILKEFRPVFHYFFTEHYLDPVTWYERRLAYTRSVATSSMVGYILGLGDRHVQNILIDKTTAEVIHIDFGIAFDQGKVLPTPETIPFRLTQDIVAGFGSSGVEGNFRRCCEKTLQLLRDNQETLLTILEVLLCDPLYLWIVSTSTKAKATNARSKLALGGKAAKGAAASVTKASGAEGDGAGGLAARAVLAVRCKLCGAEGGAAGGVSVQGHVARLVHQATDPANLCRLFHGWQPYL
ncbi:serine-protein kinase ATM-like [Maniola hyperantus]|uniref:serine-protein kinase ATM-like n=1 Tax=Aphantopus hyperantus TaxID=2795564 RepID=UPI0015690C94|nr:serine-protein kinase ATM [Maniola hyperantus]